MPEPTTAPASDKPTTVAPSPTTPGAPPVQSIDDVYGEFDQTEPAPKKELVQQRPPSSTPTKSEAAASSAKSADKKDATDSDGKAKSTVPDASTKPDTEPSKAKSDKAAVLREAYDNLKRDHANLKAEFEKVRSKPQDDARVKQLQDLLDSERKTRTELEQELKFVAYERHPEFKEKFEQPFMQEYAAGRAKTASLKTIDENGEVHQGTESDFDELMQMDDNKAADEANRRFGTKAAIVLNYRENVIRLQRMSREAVKDYRAKAEQREKEQAEARTRQEAEQEQQSKARGEALRKYIDEGKKGHSNLFTPTEGDADAQAILQRGESVADSLFTGINPKTGRPYTPDGLVKFHAFVRNTVAAHGHLMHKLKASEARLAELEGQLKEYKESATSADSGRAGEKPTQSGLAGDEEFDAAESKSGRRW